MGGETNIFGTEKGAFKWGQAALSSQVIREKYACTGVARKVFGKGGDTRAEKVSGGGGWERVCPRGDR